MRWIPCLLAAAFLAAPALAQNANQIKWTGSLAEALAEAVKRKAPVLIAIINDRDAMKEREKHEANRKMVEQVYREAEVVKATRRFVCLAAGTHCRPLDVADDNEICRQFGLISYAQLNTVTTQVKAKFFAGETEIVTPQHLILSPEGRIIERYYLAREAKEFIGLLDEAYRRFKGETPVREVAADTKSVVKALKSKDQAERAAAFRRALEILTADKDNKVVHTAAAQYLRKLKDYIQIRETLDQVTAAGSEGPLSLLLPYLKHSRARLRRGVLEVFARSNTYESFVKPLARRVKAEKAEGPLLSLVKVLDKYADKYEDALSPLNKMVSNKLPAVKVHASFAAARPKNKAVRSIFLTRARKGTDVLVRCAAILSLAKMQAKDALPVLKAGRSKVKSNGALNPDSEKARRNDLLRVTFDTAIAALGGTTAEDATPDNLEDGIQAVKRESMVADKDDNRDDRGGRGSGRGGGRGGR